jgi:membrane-associated protease RseP (regulator of RpoE activity)
LNFVLFGFPVRIHPFFWLMTAILGARRESLKLIAIWIVAVLVSILVHELGHAVAMQFYGMRPWITLYGMGGLTSSGPVAAAMAGRRLGRFGQIVISAAGPLAGFLLAAALAGVIFAAGGGADFHLQDFGHMYDRPGHIELSWLLSDMLFVCVFWGLVNLLPIYPLDGGQITQEVLLLANPRDGVRQSLLLSMITAGLLAVVVAVQWREWYLAFFFGYFAYSNYMALQAYSGGRPW